MSNIGAILETWGNRAVGWWGGEAKKRWIKVMIKGAICGDTAKCLAYNGCPWNVLSKQVKGHEREVLSGGHWGK